MLKFELSEQHIAIIAKALAAQPYGLVAPVVADIQNQINAQQEKEPQDRAGPGTACPQD
jgi:hypothetical protein